MRLDKMAKVAILETGLWSVPRNDMIQAETPEIYKKNLKMQIPGICVVVKDKALGTLLWDTGISSDWNNLWSNDFKKMYATNLSQVSDLRKELGKLEITVDDIDLLILSHLHYDHAGNVRLFQNKLAGQKILISKAEADEVFKNVCMSPDGISGAYVRNEIVMDGIGYITLKNDSWISEDVYLFIQRGHTPGVIGMMVKTEENGYLLFPSDGIYGSYNFGEPTVLPGLTIDPEAYCQNVIRIREMIKKYKAKIIFGHDRDEFNKLRLAPYWYE